MPDNDQQVRREIYERLRTIDLHLSRLAMDGTRIMDMVEHHESILCGEGSDPGMKLRMDRMEQLEFGRKWVLRTAITAVVAAVVAAISAAVAAFLGTRPSP